MGHPIYLFIMIRIMVQGWGNRINKGFFVENKPSLY